MKHGEEEEGEAVAESSDGFNEDRKRINEFPSEMAGPRDQIR